LCPDKKTAAGGIAVIHHMAAELHEQGYDTAILHSDRSAGYPDGRAEVPVFASYDIRRQAMKGHGLKRRTADRFRRAVNRLRGGLDLLHPTPDDVIVVPEMRMAEALATFPQNRKVLISQNPFSHMRSHARALEAQADPASCFVHTIGISELCVSVCDLLGHSPLGYVPVTMWPERFPFREDKEKRIAFMPRKRRDEAAVITAALEARGKLRGYQLDPIDSAPLSEVAARMARARIFISLQSREGLGFPAAEAMATGCIVVGYTGLGGDEYFDTTTGIPVPEGDTAALVRAVEDAIAEYEDSPERLDRLRRHASETVNRRYSPEAFLTSLFRVWQEVDASVSAAAQLHKGHTP
jgi:hypothetical protein